MRIGTGHDVHRLMKGRPLMLGGVEIPFEKGLLGHSDADVLIHAICDALLGAAGQGDIGVHFPDTDQKYKNISSIKLLAKTCEIIKEKGYKIINIDATVFAEAPKISPYREKMRNIIAAAAGLEPESVNIKATTFEGLGFIGRGEGIGAACVAAIDDL